LVADPCDVKVPMYPDTDALQTGALNINKDTANFTQFTNW
jgi:hypothetical protein